MEPRIRLQKVAAAGNRSGTEAGIRSPRTSGSRSRMASSLTQLYGEQPLVNDLPEPIYDPRPVEIQPRRCLMHEGMEAGTCGKGIPASLESVPP